MFGPWALRPFALRFCLSSIIVAVSLSPAVGSEPVSNNVEIASRAVVNIRTTYFDYSYKSPWLRPTVRRASGTGFIISGNRIITNAHVVSQANTLRVNRPSQRTDFEARVEHIAHDCDLAMLTVDDPAFFEDSEPLQIGTEPELNSIAEVIGFPIGGDRVSITRGIVSRLGMDRYSHSGIDHHLTIQVDAAINPGNSGGPALQNGRVIGVAFQTLRQGQNLGYLIPPVVLNRFLKDASDGKYDGYIEFGVLDFPTKNPVLRAAVGLAGAVESPNTGVLVYGVIPDSSADGHIEEGDVLLSINGKAITETGDVEANGRLRPYAEIVDNLHPGETITVELMRAGVRLTKRFPARITRVIQFQRRNYDTPPSYAIYGGLVFQPVNADLMDAYQREWAGQGHSEIIYRYDHFIVDRIYDQTKIDVVFTRRIGDRANIYADPYESNIVRAVNGEEINGFAHFIRLMDAAVRRSESVVIDFFYEETPLVIGAQSVREANQRIREQYGITEDRFYGGGFAE